MEDKRRRGRPKKLSAAAGRCLSATQDLSLPLIQLHVLINHCRTFSKQNKERWVTRDLLLLIIAVWQLAPSPYKTLILLLFKRINIDHPVSLKHFCSFCFKLCSKKLRFDLKRGREEKASDESATFTQQSWLYRALSFQTRPFMFPVMPSLCLCLHHVVSDWFGLFRYDKSCVCTDVHST